MKQIIDYINRETIVAKLEINGEERFLRLDKKMNLDFDYYVDNMGKAAYLIQTFNASPNNLMLTINPLDFSLVKEYQLVKNQKGEYLNDNQGIKLIPLLTRINQVDKKQINLIVDSYIN